MIQTISLCDICYKKVEATITFEHGAAVMHKECDVHGKFSAIVDPDAQHVSNFYRPGTMGNNNSIIIHVHDECNMVCPWCYYPMGSERMKPIEFYDSLLYEPYKGFRLMFSGGEPTMRPDYLQFTESAYKRGWNPSTITNMINLGDDDFFKSTLNEVFVDEQNNYKFAMSYQHPKNYGPDIFEAKTRALKNIEDQGLKAACVMFSIQTLDELDFIKDFYDRTRHLYSMLRIRTMFNNWANKGDKQLYLSQLHKAFLDKFSEYCPVQSSKIEQSNIYCLYMETKESRAISLSSAPTVENLDYHLCSRPVYMLANDLRCYPVAISQIIAEGMSRGWKDGYKIEGGPACSQR
jgi:MoaA/NifB/PqqE/SkfB family radical SAM enzyme